MRVPLPALGVVRGTFLTSDRPLGTQLGNICRFHPAVADLHEDAVPALKGNFRLVQCG